MDMMFDLAAANLLSAPVLFFVLGFGTTLAGSHLSLPEGASKMLAVYLMLAIGFKGGVALSSSGLDATALALLVAAVILSFSMPPGGSWLLSKMTGMGSRDRAAIAAHYGSISIVTFVAATDALNAMGIAYGGIMVAVAAAMETPAILAALLLIFRNGDSVTGQDQARRSMALREVFLNATIVILLGSFAIGAITAARGMEDLAAFVQTPFKGVLCLFLLDMGAIAARGIRKGWRELEPGLLVAAIVIPLTGATLAFLLSWMLALPVGNTALFMTLAASASYIAAPVAMRVAVPEAQAHISLAMALGITFPFNLFVGIPFYIFIAGRFGYG